MSRPAVAQTQTSLAQTLMSLLRSVKRCCTGILTESPPCSDSTDADPDDVVQYSQSVAQAPQLRPPWAQALWQGR